MYVLPDRAGGVYVADTGNQRVRRYTMAADEILATARQFTACGYTTVVLTAVFNAYFVSVVAGGAEWATLAWTLARRRPAGSAR